MTAPLQRAALGRALACLTALFVLATALCPAWADDGQADEALATWLSDLRLSKFTKEFTDLGVYDLSDVAFVRPDDLDDMGMKRIPRRKFLKAQISLIAERSSDPASPTSSSPLSPAATTMATAARMPRQSAASSLPSGTNSEISNDRQRGKKRRGGKNTDKKRTTKKKNKNKRKEKTRQRHSPAFDQAEFLRKNPSLAGLEEGLRQDLMSGQSIDSLIKMMEQMNGDRGVPASGRSKGKGMVTQLKSMLNLAKGAGVDLAGMSLTDIEDLHDGNLAERHGDGFGDDERRGSPRTRGPAGSPLSDDSRGVRPEARTYGENQRQRNQVGLKSARDMRGPVNPNTVVSDSGIQMNTETAHDLKALRKDLDENSISLVDNFLATAPPEMGEMYTSMFGESRLEEILAHAMVSAVLPTPEDSGGKIVRPLTVQPSLRDDAMGEATINPKLDDAGEGKGELMFVGASLASLASSAATQLRQEGYVVLDNAFGADTAALALGEARLLSRDGHMRPALTQDPRWKQSPNSRTVGGAGGRDAGGVHLPSIRGDLFSWSYEWLANATLRKKTPVLSKHAKRLSYFVRAVQRALSDAAGSTEPQRLRPGATMLALYPGNGAQYRPHTDPRSTGDTRMLSSVWYLTPNWKAAQGGVLRVRTVDSTKLQRDGGPEGGEFEQFKSPAATESTEGEGTVDIAPLSDRLVLFLSRSVVHQVLPTFEESDRYAATVWWHDTSSTTWDSSQLE